MLEAASGTGSRACLLPMGLFLYLYRRHRNPPSESVGDVTNGIVNYVPFMSYHVSPTVEIVLRKVKTWSKAPRDFNTLRLAGFVRQTKTGQTVIKGRPQRNKFFTVTLATIFSTSRRFSSRPTSFTAATRSL